MAGTAMKIRWVLRHNPQNRLLPPKYYAAPGFCRSAGCRGDDPADRPAGRFSRLETLWMRLRMPEKWRQLAGGRLFGGIAGNRQFAPGIFERGF